jgi:hypothetical protein
LRAHTSPSFVYTIGKRGRQEKTPTIFEDAAAAESMNACEADHQAEGLNVM